MANPFEQFGNSMKEIIIGGVIITFLFAVFFMAMNSIQETQEPGSVGYAITEQNKQNMLNFWNMLPDDSLEIAIAVVVLIVGIFVAVLKFSDIDLPAL